MPVAQWKDSELRERQLKSGLPFFRHVGSGDIQELAPPYRIKDRLIHLLNDQVLIRVIAPERMSASKKLYIPDSAKRQPYELYTGMVLACGPGERGKINGAIKPMGVRPGDKVQVYWVGAEVHVTKLKDEDGNELRIVRESHCQGIYDPS